MRSDAPEAINGGVAIYRGHGPQESDMSPRRIIGAVVLVAGVVLLLVGLNASSSVADQVSETFTGRFTKATTWYIIAGIVIGVAGLLMLAFGGRSSRASE